MWGEMCGSSWHAAPQEGGEWLCSPEQKCLAWRRALTRALTLPGCGEGVGFEEPFFMCVHA